MDTRTEELILEPLKREPRVLRVLGALLGVATAAWAWACWKLVTEGHGGLGTSSYGVSWGVTVANVVHVIGISHVGIAVSAAVRVLKLERYRNVARLAEVVTLVSLLVAVLNIALDVGRPDRFVLNVLLHGRWYAPMVWSATVISLYFCASGIYLYLSMRRDLMLLSRMPLRLRRAYGLLALGYSDTPAERARHEATLFWLAIALVPIMVSVHSVYGFFFGLLGARAGWYNPLQPPYFVLGAVVSGFSALLLVLAFVRRACGWRALLEDRTFRVFGAFLAFVVFLYLYFVASEHVTAQLGAPPAERAVSSALLSGRYSGLFWPAIAGGLAVPLVVLFLQAVRRGAPSVGAIVASAAAVNAAMLVKRVLLVIPTQQLPRLALPMAAAPYRPTLLELATTFGTYAAGGFLFLRLMRVLPLVELPVGPATEDETAPLRTPRVSLAITVAAALALIAWGIATRERDLAPLKWILGLVLLATTPLQVCVGAPGAREAAAPAGASLEVER